MKSEFDSVFQFKITLKEIAPPIWRRIHVPGTYGFWDLHVAIEDALGWWDYHLHEFELNDPLSGKKTRIGMLDDDIELLDDREVLSENECKIADWFSPQNNEARYLYDFGDGWEHEVVLERILPREKGVEYPVCTGGERAGPPEDCGGVGGYAELLEVIIDVKHVDYDSMMEWFGIVLIARCGKRNQDT
ncbi:MAG: plasmid pRiA4b ORF-3 family protein [Actinobacteria bacterium]|nr:plasmid pRiA4b ORF-3 family protein [Actinomycetota bacterium]